MMKVAVAAVLLLAACPKHDEDYKKQKPPEEEAKEAAPPPPPPKPAKKALTEDEMGECKLTASGGLKAEQTTKGGQGATNISYWRSEQERAGMMGLDGFAINCFGSDIRFSMTPGGKKDGMPFAPKKYDFKPVAKNAEPRDAAVNITFGKQTLDAVTGTVNVTAFDKHHIAGTIDVSGKTVPGKQAVTVKGTFDLICPNFAGCE